MLRLQSITLENFGPYKGRQEIVFPATDGVVLIYGENMRGKTTLLNAFRYALFGKFIGRGQSQIPIHKIGNWEAGEEGVYGFKVELNFSFGADQYVLTRICSPRRTPPKTDADYDLESFLTKNNSQLSGDQTTHTLSLIMPEDVSRFFLFDGELLQQYEELLRDESSTGQEIKQAIERILGLPVLTNGRLDFSQLQRNAARSEARAATADNRTQLLGAQTETLIAKQEIHRKEVARLIGELGRQKQAKLGLEEDLKQFEKFRALFIERDRLNSDLQKEEVNRTTCLGKLMEAMAEAWKIVLGPHLKERRQDLEELALSIKLAEERRAYAAKVSVDLQSSLDAGKCGTCGHELESTAKNAIRERIATYSVDSKATSRAEELLVVEKHLSALQELEPRTSRDYLFELQEQLDQGRVHTASIHSRISEILEQTRNADESEVRRLQSEHDRVVRDMTLVAEGIKGEQRELDDTTLRLQKVQEDLKKVAGHDLARFRRKREMCQKLHALFSSAVDVYREKLRTDVAVDATDLFLQLTTEPEYRELQINENYGLSIVHQSGQTITIRSAGAEHIVALSLMGALQKNAPLRGPIIMDSPFGRLDSGHTERVVKTLPLMSSQAILLVYESELEPDLARGVLGDALRREYKIVRKSARHSSLERQV